jgi:hypothetical protein
LPVRIDPDLLFWAEFLGASRYRVDSLAPTLRGCRYLGELD